MLFSTLQAMYQQGGDIRLLDQLRRSILSCLAVDDNHDNIMDVYYSIQSSFFNLIVDRMLQSYWRALSATPRHSGSRHVQENYLNEEVHHYLKTVQFCNALTKLPHRSLFTEKLLDLLSRKFLTVVISGLLSEYVLPDLSPHFYPSLSLTAILRPLTCTRFTFERRSCN